MSIAPKQCPSAPKRAQNNASISLCNLRTLKPRRVNYSLARRPQLLTFLSFLNPLNHFNFNYGRVNTLFYVDIPARTVQPYKKTPTIQPPAILDYISSFLWQPLLYQVQQILECHRLPLAPGKLGMSCFFLYRGSDMNSQDEDDLIPIHSVATWT